MWERLIKLYPRFIVRYKDNYKPYFKLALERGYSVLEKDLQINPYLAQNDDVMKDAIKNINVKIESHKYVKVKKS